MIDTFGVVVKVKGLNLQEKLDVLDDLVLLGYCATDSVDPSDYIEAIFYRTLDEKIFPYLKEDIEGNCTINELRVVSRRALDLNSLYNFDEIFNPSDYQLTNEEMESFLEEFDKEFQDYNEIDFLERYNLIDNFLDALDGLDGFDDSDDLDLDFLQEPDISPGISHSALIREYAEDVMNHPAPWELWEVYNSEDNSWETLKTHPQWNPKTEYRRIKRVKITKSGEIPQGVPTAEDWNLYFVPDISDPDGYKIIVFDSSNCNHKHLLKNGMVHRTSYPAVEQTKLMMKSLSL